MKLAPNVGEKRNSRGVIHATIATLFLMALACMPLVAYGAEFNTVKPGQADISQFASSSSCTCHSELLNQWAYSMHARALSDPFYLDQVEEARKDGGDELVQFCHSCHAPGAVMSGQDVKKAAQSNDGVDGITCTVCHQTVGHTSKKPGNVSLGYTKGSGPDGIYRAQLSDPKAPHPAAELALFNDSEMCGACHNVFHPTNGIQLEGTYDEWKASSYGKKGTTCQTCHMVPDTKLKAPYKATVATGADERDNVFAMTFVGANVAQSDSELATALLKSAAKVETKIEGSDIMQAGEKGKVTTTVTNIGAGHDLPTGLAGIRNMWLSVVAIDAQGNKTEIGKTQFGVKAGDSKGNDVGAAFWRTAKILENTAIKAGESNVLTADYTMPAGMDAVAIVANLNYQSARDADIAASGIKNPTTVMASAKAGFYTSEEAKAAALKKAEEDAKAAEDSKESTSTLLGQPSKDNGVFLGVIIGAAILVLAIVIILVIRFKKKD